MHANQRYNANKRELCVMCLLSILLLIYKPAVYCVVCGVQLMESRLWFSLQFCRLHCFFKYISTGKMAGREDSLTELMLQRDTITAVADESSSC